MMILTIHSYKGGTGKTSLAVNLAMIIASRGKKVCLLDLDLRAPSINTTFQNRQKFWINDYLNKICKFDNVLNDCTPAHFEGKLFVVLANPNLQAIREISSKGRKWEMEALARIIYLKNFIHEGIFDFIIVDSGPGVQYSSINAIVAADLVLFVTSLDASDIKGTQHFLADLHDIFEKKTEIIVNKSLQSKFLGTKVRDLQFKDIPVMEVVPCSCDILRSHGDYLFVYNQQSHPVKEKYVEIANKLENLKIQNAISNLSLY